MVSQFANKLIVLNVKHLRHFLEFLFCKFGLPVEGCCYPNFVFTNGFGDCVESNALKGVSEDTASMEESDQTFLGLCFEQFGVRRREIGVRRNE